MTNIPEHHRRNIEAGYVRRDGMLPPSPIITKAELKRATDALDAAKSNGPVTIAVGGWEVEVTRLPETQRPITGINIQPGMWGKTAG